MAEKPYSQACENNKTAILPVLQQAFAGCKTVLEIGSGTGQHAVYFAAGLPHLTWQPSDREMNLAGMQLWFDEVSLDNLAASLQLDVTERWPDAKFDGLFTANTLHIMSWPTVQQLFAGLADVSHSGTTLAIYGPFNYDGRFTSDSNARFDAQLKSRDAAMGIRDVEAVCTLAQQHRFSLLQDYAMPANNRLLVFKRQ